MAKLTKAVKMDATTQKLIQHEQAKLSDSDLVGGKVLIQMEDYSGTRLPTDWDIDTPLHDILMVEYVDENEFGEVLRDGIWVKQEITSKLWRVGRVIKAGPNSNPHIKDRLIMFPSDKGIPLISFNGKKYIFLNEDRVFAVLKERENND